jgi:protein SCO1/2
MRQVQTLTAEMPQVKLVSFTVDPERDTPAVLAEYAARFKYDPARWVFLTGDEATLNDLGFKGFKLNSVDGSLNHSTRFVLVDRRRRIRGYLSSTEDDFLRRVVHDIRQLERERS